MRHIKTYHKALSSTPLPGALYRGIPAGWSQPPRGLSMSASAFIVITHVASSLERPIHGDERLLSGSVW